MLTKLVRRLKMIVVGIDPGKKGAIAKIYMKNDKPKEYEIYWWKDEADLVFKIKEVVPESDLVGLERVHAMPKQGVVSMFSFGEQFGLIKGALYALDIPFELIEPKRWQKFFLKDTVCNLADRKKVLEEKIKEFSRHTFRLLKNDVNIRTADSLGIALYTYYSQIAV